MATVKIVHPDLGEGSITEVDETAMPHYYRSGWRLLTDDEVKAQDAPEPEPRPMTKAQAAKAAAKTAEEK